MFQKYFVKIYLRVGIEEGVGICIFVTVQTERDLDGPIAFFSLLWGVPKPMEDDSILSIYHPL